MSQAHNRGNRPPPPRASGIAENNAHWLDRLEAGVKAHIQTMQVKRDELVAQARPPQAVLDAPAVDPEAVKLGAGLNKAYAAALRMGKGQHPNVLERAKYAAEDYLAHLPPEQRGAILLGALASVYGREDGGADTAVWLAGSKEEATQPLNRKPVSAASAPLLLSGGLSFVLLIQASPLPFSANLQYNQT